MIKVSLKEAEKHLGELIEEASAESYEPPKAIGRALDRFIGTWSAEQEAEVLKAIEIFEQVDKSFWQVGGPVKG
jgi:hypothetical protein